MQSPAHMEHTVTHIYKSRKMLQVTIH